VLHGDWSAASPLARIVQLFGEEEEEEEEESVRSAAQSVSGTDGPTDDSFGRSLLLLLLLFFLSPVDRLDVNGVFSERSGDASDPRDGALLPGAPRRLVRPLSPPPARRAGGWMLRSAPSVHRFSLHHTNISLKKQTYSTLNGVAVAAAL